MKWNGYFLLKKKLQSLAGERKSCKLCEYMCGSRLPSEELTLFLLDGLRVRWDIVCVFIHVCVSNGVEETNDEVDSDKTDGHHSLYKG